MRCALALPPQKPHGGLSRIWSRRTVCQTFLQSMECQSGVRSGAAPAGISAADISACLPESVDQGSLVRRHQREVRPLSRRVISSEGSTLIRPIPGRHSLPPSSSARHPISNLLAEGLPREEDDGLTTFHGCTTDGLGSASPPMARQRRQGNREPLHLAIYLLVQACQRHWLA